jgi:hypothetical protein
MDLLTGVRDLLSFSIPLSVFPTNSDLLRGMALQITTEPQALAAGMSVYTAWHMVLGVREHGWCARD